MHNEIYAPERLDYHMTETFTVVTHLELNPNNLSTTLPTRPAEQSF